MFVVGLCLLNQLCVGVYKPLDLQGETSVWCADSNPAGREEKEWARSDRLCVLERESECVRERALVFAPDLCLSLPLCLFVFLCISLSVIHVYISV